MTSNADAKAYYERRWDQEPKANLWAMQRCAVILSEISGAGIKSPRILDLGCGTGWMTAVLSQFGQAEGVDLAPAAARKFHPHLTFYDVDAPLHGPYDIIVSQEVLEHVDNQQAYLTKANQLLRSGGYLVLTTPNASVSLRRPEMLIQPNEKHLTARELRGLLNPHFDVEKLYSFFFGYAPHISYRLQMRFGRQLNAGLHLMAVARRR